MLVERITKLSAADFAQRTAGKKLVLLYPLTTYRRAFLSYWLQMYQERLLYYRVMSPQANLQSFLSTMSGDLERYGVPGITRLRAVLASGTPAEWGIALSAALNSYSDQQGKTAHFFDDVDIVEPDSAFNPFFQSLMDQLQRNVQIVLNARWLNRDVFIKYVQCGDAVILGNEWRDSDGIFDLDSAAVPHLEIRAFGQGRVYLNGRLADGWDGVLPRNLFFFLVDRPLVTRDEIFKTFWPTLSHKEATNVFHVTKRKMIECLSKALPDQPKLEIMQYQSGFYLPGENLARYYDVSDFQSAIAAAESAADTGEEQRHYERAINLYTYPFLESVDMGWAAARHEQLRQLYVQALASLGRTAWQQSQYHKAVGYYARALAQIPERSDLRQALVELYTLL